MKILIVDDMKENLLLLNTLLTGFRHTVVQAMNGQEALQKLKNDSFDMIVSDILMPVMDGYELCQKCKSDPDLHQILFIFYTATYTDKEDEKYAMQLGADRFLIKPMDPGDFMTAIRSVAQKAEQHKIPHREPAISDIETIKKHRDRLLNKLGKKVDELNIEISERKKAEEKYWQLIESTPHAIMIHSDGKIIYSNQAGFRLLEVDNGKKLVGRNLLDFIHSDYHEQFKEKTELLLTGATLSKSCHGQFLTINGTSIDVEVTCLPTIYNGKTAIQLIIWDITEQKKAENILRNNEAQQAIAMKIAKLGYWEYDAVNKIFTFNDAFYSIYHTTAEKEGGFTMPALQYFKKFIHPDDRRLVENTMNEFLQTGNTEKSYQFEHRIIYSTGETGTITVHFNIIKDQQGRIVKLLGANQDISERKKIESSLQESEERYRMIADHVGDVVWQLDPTLHFVYVSPAVQHVLGYTIEETLGELVTDYLNEDEMQKMKQVIQKRMTSPLTPPTPTQYKMKHKDGHWVDVEVVSSPVFTKNGQFSGFAGITRDITERKRGEKALEAANQRLRILHRITETVHKSLELNVIFSSITQAVVTEMGFSTAIVVTLDADGEIYRVRSLISSKKYMAQIDKLMGHPFKNLSFPANRIIKAAQNTTATGEMIIKSRLYHIACPPFKKIVCEQMQKLSDSKSYILAPLVLSGKTLGALVVSSPKTINELQDADLEMLGTFASTAVQAIANAGLLAETNKAKEQIQDNLEEKEVLLRELYHRTKNNMQVIASMLRIHASRLKDENLKRICYDVENKILSMAIVHQKLYESQNLSHLNLKEYFNNLLELLANSFAADHIKFTLEGDDVKVLIDTAIPCGLILNELITNSIKHAFPDNREGEIKVRLYLTRKNELVIQVADNGAGLPPGFNFKKDMRLGLESVIVLVEHQLQGKINFKNHNGLYCKIVLKEELYQPRI
ncbi:MAG TPA: PAS domain S-box protein [bacterium]|nr:PAS domain S-box protein [bacterium]HPN41965.1 PAS domain S-box protein [bacterium]